MREKIDVEKLEKKILYRFLNNRVFGKHHWREDTVKKGYPSHARKIVMKIVEKLRRKGILIMKPTPHGKQWWLNLEKIQEINKILKDGY